MCAVDMRAEFTTYGAMHYSFERKCVKPEDNLSLADNDSCEENGSVDTLQREKSCKKVCDEADCNNNNDIELLFGTMENDAPRYQFCYGYSSDYDDDYYIFKPASEEFGLKSSDHMTHTYDLRSEKSP